MSTSLAACRAHDKQPTGRFPLLDVGPRPVALGRYSGLNAAPLLPLRGRARGYTPSAHITSPLGARHVGPMAPAHGRAGRPGLATVKPLARPLCVGGGALPPADLARVGAGTPLDRAYGHRLPRPVSSRVGRELRPGLRGAGRLPHCYAVAPHARARACKPVRSGGAHIKLGAIGVVEERAQYPAATTQSTKRETRVRRRVAQREARREGVSSLRKFCCAVAYSRDHGA